MWFFNVGAHEAPLNFAGRIGAFLAELSYQLLGFSAFLLPVVLVVIGWHYFWCKPIDAPYTKAAGAALLLACVASFTSLRRVRRRRQQGIPRPAGILATGSGGVPDYLNRTGAIILILTLLFPAIILDAVLVRALLRRGRGNDPGSRCGAHRCLPRPPRRAAP